MCSLRIYLEQGQLFGVKIQEREMVRKATPNSPLKGKEENKHLDWGRQMYENTHRSLPWWALSTEPAIVHVLNSFCFKLYFGFDIYYICIVSYPTQLRCHCFLVAFLELNVIGCSGHVPPSPLSFPPPITYPTCTLFCGHLLLHLLSSPTLHLAYCELQYLYHSSSYSSD